MENENASKLNGLGAVSLVLSALVILALLGNMIVFCLVIPNADDPCGIICFISRLLDTYTRYFAFPLWALPLGLVNVIVASLARKRGSDRQKKVAGGGITVGIIGIITSCCIISYILFVLFSIY